MLDCPPAQMTLFIASLVLPIADEKSTKLEISHAIPGITHNS